MEKEIKKTGKISWATRFAYGGGDAACNVVFGMIGTVLTMFYTDYVGVAAAAIGMIMLYSRVFDGVSDIIMGFIVEKTNSKWGKSRPWVLWMSLPFAISAVLLFTVPQTTTTLQLLYIFVTYNFCNTICYTALNLPYGSLSAMMTRESRERDMLSIVRTGVAPFGKILAVSCTLPLVKMLGNTQQAWVLTMSVWAGLALILLLICFLKCEETVVIEAKKKQAKIPILKSIRALLTNRYFWVILILWSIQCILTSMTGTILPYYCKYVFNNDSMYSLLYFLETIVLVGATFYCPSLLKRFGKRNMALAGTILGLCAHLMFFLNTTSVTWMVVSCVLRSLCFAPLNSVIFGFIGDAVEYGQWKTHIRQESMIFAGGSAGAKIGMGIATSILTYLLDWSGYISSTSGAAVQPESAIQMIINIYKFGPAIVWAVSIVILFFYKLDKLYPKIMQDLTEREARGEL